MRGFIVAGILEKNEPRAQQAVDYFVYRAVKEIGALTAVLGGLDALVFTGGIGEHSSIIRQRICDTFSWLEMELDTEANKRNDVRISSVQSSVSVWVIPTDEEQMIVRHIRSLLSFPTVTV
jgi:acetate kinase